MFNPIHSGGEPAVRLEAVIGDLDPIVALLSLIHITGDRQLLHRYGPLLEGTEDQKRAAFVNLGSREHKQADPAVVAEIRAMLAQEMARSPEPLMREPDPALFRDMLKLALGQELPEASIEPARHHGGFVTDTRVHKPEVAPPADFNVLVIGGGMHGINAAVKLKQAGFSYTVLESRHEIGGTWSVNRYPGAAVDTPSVQYSYSFDPNPSWTKFYPMKDEFLQYLERVADKHRIRPHVHLNTTMQSADWDEARQLWIVKAIRDGEAVTYEANAVILSVGVLSRPRWPDVRGRDRFNGPVLHSAAWDEDVDLTGKRVVIVGTGCSGVQLTRAISEFAGHVTTVQRQPDYIIPNPQALAPVPELERLAMERIPYVTQWKRMQSLASQMMDMRGMMGFDKEWNEKTGGFGPLNDAVTKMSLDYLKSHFPDDPEMVRKLTPPYPLYAKRPILDCGYYDALKRPNVDLIEGQLAGFEEDAVILADGTRIECDAVVLATGFHLDWYSNMHFAGRDGRTLKETFTPYPYAYEGITVPGFPNLFITHGPNCNLTANAAVIGEQQVHYIVELLQTMIDEDIAAVEPDVEATRAYNDWTQEKLLDTAWYRKGSAHGYYRHDDSGRIVIATPRHNSTVWHAMRQPEMEHFVLTYRPNVEKRAPRPMSLLSI
ncbi:MULTISPECIES: flavin-containing monooxygenase [Sphingobium]|jgi:cation diffusion facilitator CzcD-associated flavoprotein CzcO|uniref:Flavin-containing monooxygenase n=1 Tax=Sphingobium tyrosinilyticum TaxID=2715436 RepID=A0ABV9EVQ4_9SPHN|nr:NAD(P)/FAD-dependent oxidoreductase [Sphingobium sp. EP60837]ANI77702.1 4-hydroxyacetophenone monooxygenase [Sphingobium sp. EP60837]